MIGLLRGALALRYVRYALVSGIALALDFGLLGFLVAAGVEAMLAAAIGYGAGILAHWACSSRAVFADALAEGGHARRQQQMLFLLSAFAGLAITIGIVGAGTFAGLDPRLAKIAAVAISFQATYLMRRHIVFA